MPAGLTIYVNVQFETRLREEATSKVDQKDGNTKAQVAVGSNRQKILPYGQAGLEACAGEFPSRYNERYEVHLVVR
jgi:hypothetical protein